VGWNSTLRSKSVGGLPIGTPCNANGSAATCAELAVDPETGEVEILGYWNAVDTGRTIFKQGATKEMLSGCELQIHQALFAGDVYDMPSGACISSQFTESMLPTAMDMKGESFHAYDIESDDAAGPYGAHGIGEPCVTNYSAIICAIFNATGKWVDPEKGACTPNKILKALGKA
jgi:CO/xanthine dehydrogenase Mo-binding subunit